MTAWATAPNARAATTVVPSGNAAVEGNVDNRWPFATAASSGDDTMRYQQVYGASQFGTSPILITQITFRPDAALTSAFTLTDSNIRIDLSTTSAAPDGLDTTFANNVGANNTTVFNGLLSLSSANSGPAAGPKAFDITINLTTPFLYDPNAGNLLLDVRNFVVSSSDGSIFFDADSTVGDSTSRVVAFDVNATGADLTDSIGLVTQFTFSPASPNGGGGGGSSVPLPPGVVAAVPLAAIAGCLRRRWMLQ